MKITVLCPTFRRPHLLSHLIWCFTQQTHEDRELIVLSDGGDLLPSHGDRWRVEVADARYPSLGAKRNALALMSDAGAICQFDDDDLYLPWHLEAAASAIQSSPQGMAWSRPSEVLHIRGGTLSRHYTWNHPSMADKAYQGGWVYSRDLFVASGGYNVKISNGEDRELQRAFIAAGAVETDPVTAEYPPSYIWGPTPGWHLSSMGPAQVGYDWMSHLLRRSDVLVRVGPIEPPGIRSITKDAIPNTVLARPWGGDWK
jgi:hypothetical protein